MNNYDSWLEQPYQDMYAEADRMERYQEWVAENSTYETSCCGVEIKFLDVDFDSKGNPTPVHCVECGEMAELYATPPVEYDAGDEY